MSTKMTIPNDARKVFWKCGTCSCTFFYLLNREFGHMKGDEEIASHPLSGGLMKRGYQCGMLWGCSLAVGAESFRRHNADRGKAITAAIMTTRYIMSSFSSAAKNVDCRAITGCDLMTRLGMMKLMFRTIFGGFIYSHCFNLAQNWAPEAIRAAREGLSLQQDDSARYSMSCASEVVKRMGGTDEESVMVAGFAGGLGLSGNACGALGAAIWMNALVRNRQNPGGKKVLYSEESEGIVKRFLSMTNSEMLCSRICGRYFTSPSDHTEFLKGGGCNRLIDQLSGKSGRGG